MINLLVEEGATHSFRRERLFPQTLLSMKFLVPHILRLVQGHCTSLFPKIKLISLPAVMAEHLDSLTLLFNFAYSIALPCIDWLEMDLQRKVNEETGLL